MIISSGWGFVLNALYYGVDDMCVEAGKCEVGRHLYREIVGE